MTYSGVSSMRLTCGLSDAQVGAFSEALMTEAQKSGWIVISIKNHWKRISF